MSENKEEEQDGLCVCVHITHMKVEIQSSAQKKVELKAADKIIEGMFWI